MESKIDKIVDIQCDMQPEKNLDNLLRKELIKETYHEDSKLNKERKEREEAGVDNGGYKYKDPLEYTAQEFNDFKQKLAKMVSTDGITTMDTFYSAEYKNFISNYVDTHFYKEKDINILNRLKFRLEYLDIGMKRVGTGEDTTVRFPIVTEWKGHFLVRATYFKKTMLGLEACVVPVKTASIILT